MAWSVRIVNDSHVLAGKPVVRGTRLAVEFILELLAAGQSEAEILDEYPGLTKEDISACLGSDKRSRPRDPVLLKSAEAEGRLLVTLDKHFWQIALQRPEPISRCGVMLFRIHPAVAEKVTPLARKALKSVAKDGTVRSAS